MKLLQQMKKDLKLMKQIDMLYQKTSFCGALAADMEPVIEEHINYVEKEIKRLELYQTKYGIQTSVNGIIENFEAGYTEIFSNKQDYEVFHALTEIIEEINELEVGNTILFNPMRGNKHSKGIITRIK